MFTATINIGSLLNSYPLTKQDLTNICQKVLQKSIMEVDRNLRKNARSSLKSTRNIYIAGINKPVLGRMQGSITLTGMIPNMIEQGCSAIDLKVGFSNSDKKQLTESGGWYLTVPFRYGTSDAIGESEVFNGVMPAAVEKIAKQMTGGSTTPFSESKSSGGRVTKDDLAKIGMDELGSRAPFSEIESGEEFGSYEHVAPIFEGLQRESKDYEAVSQGKYVTFRRVSDKSDSQSWIHPGIIAYNLMPKALDDTDLGTIVSNTIDEELNNLGFK